MIENEKGPRIRKTPPTRNPQCFQTQQDIVIPAGTILRNIAGTDRYAADLGVSPGIVGEFSVERKPGCTASPNLRRVSA
jgi:hypothetical protein